MFLVFISSGTSTIACSGDDCHIASKLCSCSVCAYPKTSWSRRLEARNSSCLILLVPVTYCVHLEKSFYCPVLLSLNPKMRIIFVLEQCCESGLFAHHTGAKSYVNAEYYPCFSLCCAKQSGCLIYVCCRRHQCKRIFWTLPLFQKKFQGMNTTSSYHVPWGAKLD